MMIVKNKHYMYLLFFFNFSLVEPCDGCAAPYGYKNIMRLSQDTRHFAVRKKIYLELSALN